VNLHEPEFASTCRRWNTILQPAACRTENIPSTNGLARSRMGPSGASLGVDPCSRSRAPANGRIEGNPAGGRSNPAGSSTTLSGASGSNPGLCNHLWRHGSPSLDVLAGESRSGKRRLPVLVPAWASGFTAVHPLQHVGRGPQSAGRQQSRRVGILVISRSPNEHRPMESATRPHDRSPRTASRVPACPPQVTRLNDQHTLAACFQLQPLGLEQRCGLSHAALGLKLACQHYWLRIARSAFRQISVWFGRLSRQHARAPAQLRLGRVGCVTGWSWFYNRGR
jgi:hypothetical protein